MLRRMRTLAAGLVVPAAFGLSSPFLAGCNSGDQAGGKTETASSEGQGEHGHEHGPGTHQAHGDEGGHSHPSEGPHGGQILEFGSADYHAELVHDEQSGAVTVHILDSGATKPTPVEAAELTVNVKKGGEAKQYRLTAAPEEGETGGKSSRFTTDDKALGDDLHAGAEARLVAKIGGRSYNAAIEHGHAHGGHGHSHTGDDALIWRQEGVKEGDYTISLGHHGTDLHAGQPVEPAVMVTKGGQDVADAKVFNALLAEDGKTVVAEEKPTVYEPKTDEEPAHYAQGELTVPQDAKKVVLRFRVVLPEGGEKTFDVPVEVK